MNRGIKELVPELVYEDVCSIAERDLPWEKLKNKTIVITGANGFISYYMALACLLRNDLYQDGIQICALVRSKANAEKKYKDILNRDDIMLLVQDVCENLQIEKADYVIHAASQASAWHFEHDPVGTINANLLGMRNVLETAKKTGAEVLFISSLKVYGSFQKNKETISEEDAGYIDQTSFKNCYAVGKLAAETLCASYHKQYGIPVKIVRPSYIYGPASLNDDRVWAQFIANVVRNQNILLKSSGAPYRSYCYVTDTAAAIFTVLLKGTIMQPYNISAEESNVSIRDFAKKAIAVFPEKNLKLSFEHPEDEKEPDLRTAPREILNNQRLLELGWKAEVSLEQGIRRTALIMASQETNQPTQTNG